MPGGRDLKKHVLDMLGRQDWEDGLQELLPNPQAAVGPLFSALCASSSLVRWHAVTAFGLVIAALAGHIPEKARVVMRRFLWSLNDESGGIGWGSPEAMAEIMVQSPLMASEYHNHLLAYIHEDHCRPDCYLEHAPLRRGAVWGVARLAQARPELMRPAETDLLLALEDTDGIIRGFSAWACGVLRLNSSTASLHALLADPTPVELYRDRMLLETTTATLAQEALTLVAPLSANP